MKVLTFLILLLFVSFLGVKDVNSQAGYDPGVEVGQPQDITETHIEAVPNAVSTDLVKKGIGEGTAKGSYNSMGLDFYPDISVSAGGYALNVEDGICSSDKVRISDIRLSGEWFTKGGPHDSPPVQFSDDIDSVIDSIKSGDYKTKVYRTYVCAWTGVAMKSNCDVDAQIICSRNCTLKTSNLEKLGDGYRIKEGAESVGVEMECKPFCFVFVDRERYEKAYGIMALLPLGDKTMGIGASQDVLGTTTIGPMFENLLTCSQKLDFTEAGMALAGLKEMTKCMAKGEPFRIKARKTYKIDVERSGLGPEIEAKKIYKPENSGSGQVLRIELVNTGDMEGIIEDVKLNLDSYKILYRPKSLKPGEMSEALLQIEPENKEVQAEISYRSEKLGCLGKRDFSSSFSIGLVEGQVRACSADTDCPTDQTCCAELCRPSSKGVCDDIDGDGAADTWVQYFTK
jgi:hypothetical protein